MDIVVKKMNLGPLVFRSLGPWACGFLASWACLILADAFRTGARYLFFLNGFRIALAIAYMTERSLGHLFSVV